MINQQNTIEKNFKKEMWKNVINNKCNFGNIAKCNYNLIFYLRIYLNDNYCRVRLSQHNGCESI